MLSYKLQVEQELKGCVYRGRTEFYVLQNTKGDASFLVRAIHFDKCVFRPDKNISKHDVSIWRAENPHKTKEIAKDSGKNSCVVRGVCESSMLVFTFLTAQ